MSKKSVDDQYKDVFDLEPSDSRNILYCPYCNKPYKGCWRGKRSLEKHIRDVHRK